MKGKDDVNNAFFLW